MPLDFKMVRGRPGGIRLRHIGQGSTAPSPVTITVTGAGAAAGALAIPISSLAMNVPKNTVLQFDRAANNPDIVEVVTTQDETSGATTLHVDTFDGAVGDGLAASLASADSAVWDQLYTDIASQNLDFSKNAQTQELTAVTHGSATGVTIARSEVTSVSPSVPRQGLFFTDGPLIKDILRYGDTNANWWVKYTVPDENGFPFAIYEGLAVVQNVGHPTPADNLVQLNYEARFIEMPVVTFLDELS